MADIPTSEENILIIKSLLDSRQDDFHLTSDGGLEIKTKGAGFLRLSKADGDKVSVITGFKNSGIITQVTTISTVGRPEFTASLVAIHVRLNQARIDSANDFLKSKYLDGLMDDA